MWFIGLVLGLVVGGAAGGFGVAILGALIGALAGAMIGGSRSDSDTGGSGRGRSDNERLRTLETQVEWLHREAQALRKEVAALRAAATTPASPAQQAAATDAMPPDSSRADLAAPPAPAVPMAVRIPTPVSPFTVMPQTDSAAVPVAPPAEASAGALTSAGIPSTAKLTAPADLSPEAARKAVEANLAARETAGEASSAATVRGMAGGGTASASPAAAEADVPPTAPPPRTPTRKPLPMREAPADAGETLWQRLVGGNLVAKIGVVILFFGVGFLLKYAYERALLPPEFRLAGVAAAGFAMLWLGRRLLATRRLYALILQGGGLGILYLDVFFALKIFNLLGPVAAFALFLVLGVCTVLLAVRQDSRSLAVLGLIGAFLAPPLSSRGGGSHVLLFSYYLLLNGFILGVSWFKAWRELNLTGFLFTFVISVLWGANAYQPAHFATVEPFLLAYFAMYLVIPILFARRQPPQLKGLVDGTLVFGTPMAVAFMQAGLVRGMGDHALAWSAAVGAGIYALLAAVTWREAWSRLLAETYVALAVLLATLAIFFAFDAYPTFALWTLEGAAVLWVGLRQKRLLARLFGMALEVVGALYFLVRLPGYQLGNPWFNDFTVGCGLIVVAALISARLLWRFRATLSPIEMPLAAAFLAWATLWWFAGGLHALHHGLADRLLDPAAGLLYAAGTFAAVELAGRRLAWPALRLVTLAQPLAMLAAALAMLGNARGHPLGHLGYVAWPLVMAVHFWCLHRQQRDGIALTHGPRALAGWVLLTFLGTWEAAWLLQHHHDLAALGWSLLGFAVAALRFRLRERGVADAAPISRLALAWAFVVYLLAGWGLMREYFQPGYAATAMLGFVATSCLIAELIGSRTAWPDLRRAALLMLPAIAVTFMAQLADGDHPLHGNGPWAWPLALAMFYGILWRQERDDFAVARGLQHAAGLWLVATLASWELHWQATQLPGGDGWRAAALGLPTALLLRVVARRAVGDGWPCGRHASIYLMWALPPLAAWGVLWTLLTNFGASGQALPLPHVPLLNPLDLVQAAMFAGLWSWRCRLDEAESVVLPDAAVRVLAGALGFLWLNGIVLRAVHHWAGVPFEMSALLHSMIAQSAFALLWSATALLLMRLATGRGDRTQWVAGACLLAVVAIKLFVIDLGNSGTVARIVSFIGVGVLLMVIGYVAPVPPGTSEKQAD